jgi:4-amino-4-deoxy-L-arabinose transferase-like glycosyltransferase
MFDMVFTFWVLLGLLGILQAAEGDRRRHGLLLLAVGIAGGILTKGPAVLIYLLPLPFLRSLWSRRMDRPRRGKWYRSVSGALLLGAGIALLWVVPAILLGGASYRHEILWKQTADRITSSFAHRRPFWWYLPILPLLFFPWILFRPAFRRFRLKTADTGTRFCLLWMGIPLLIFSLISGKQVHYLLPFIPAGALLAGRNLCLSEFDGRKSSVKLFGLFYFAAGLVIACLPLIPLKTPAVVFAVVPTEIASAGLLSIGAFLYFFRFPSFSSAVKCLAVSTAVIAALTFFQIKNSLMESYDIKPVARAVQKNMENGRAVAHIGKYHGQYQFLGRLKQPLTVLDDNPDQISDFAKRWPGALFISYSRGKNTLPDDATVCYTHKYRGKTVVLWQMESAHGP